jgi:RNA polymerase subunit RPABC4/transcription elongation factor Spt4
MSDPIDLSKAGDEPADRDQLVMCERCGRDVPADSTRCPACGAPVGAAFQIAPSSETAQRWPGLARFGAGLFLGLAVALLLAYLGVR